jgi:hypothetical protein
MIEIDATKLYAVIGDLREALTASGGDASNIMAEETGRLALQIMRFTPPMNEAQGKAAVEKQIKSLFSEAHADLIAIEVKRHGTRGIDDYITGKDGKKIHLLWGTVDPTGDRMREIHLRTIDRRTGHIPKMITGDKGTWLARAVVPQGKRGPYIAKIQAHIGRWKATWAQVASELGIRAGIPGFVKRHLPSQKAIFDASGLQNTDGPSITFGSSAPGAAREAARIRDAINERVKKIKRRINLAVSGYNQAVAQGMKLRAKQRSYNDE